MSYSNILSGLSWYSEEHPRNVDEKKLFDFLESLNGTLPNFSGNIDLSKFSVFTLREIMNFSWCSTFRSCASQELVFRELVQNKDLTHD